MSSTDAEYQEAFEAWVKCQQNSIKQIELNIQNSKKMIAVHKESLLCQQKALLQEKKLLLKAIEVHNN